MNQLQTGQQTICIIDDDKIQHFTLEKSMQLQGLKKNLICFNDGEEALTFFSQHSENLAALPDIIFLDINMPVVNGWQFLHQYELIKDKIKKDIKIYMVSSSVNPHEISRATSNVNVTGYFCKPVKREEIKRVFTIYQ